MTKEKIISHINSTLNKIKKESLKADWEDLDYLEGAYDALSNLLEQINQTSAN